MSFDTLGLRPDLLARLAEGELTQPTPIQTGAIPEVLKGRDVMGLAQTGTGKTLAFGLPILQQLLDAKLDCVPKAAHCLILAPTRELAAQIHDSLAKMTKGLPIRLRLVMGGVSINPQIKKLEGGMHVLVATPGRLLDLVDQKALRLDTVKHLVLDEADQMLDMGFIHALRRIARLVPKQRQTLLFSATMPQLMAEVAASFLSDPVRIAVTPPGKTADRIEQSVIHTPQASKPDVLAELLCRHPSELALVFARTKHGSDRLARRLAGAGLMVAAIHGNKSQNQRIRALDGFRSGELKVLVATDVAARGIDIPEVRHVYNFDLPNVPDTYVHRIGRTARAGRDGRAVTLCAPEETGELRAIEKLIGRKVPVASSPVVSENFLPPDTEPERAPRGGGGGRGRSQGGGNGQGRGGARPAAPKSAPKAASGRAQGGQGAGAGRGKAAGGGAGGGGAGGAAAGRGPRRRSRSGSPGRVGQSG